MASLSREAVTQLIRTAFLNYIRTNARGNIDSFTLDELRAADANLGEREYDHHYRLAIRYEIAHRERDAAIVQAIDSKTLTAHILDELRIMNMHLSCMTNEDITKNDLEDIL